MENKKILLLGGTGTLSYAVLKESLNKGYCVYVMNRGSNNEGLPRNVKIIICDFKDKKALEYTFADKRFDIIVDFLSREPSDIIRAYDVFANKCEQYIFISSACVFKRNDENLPIKEDSPKPNETWSYNTLKYECELKLQELARSASSYFTIIRPYITYNNERIPLGITPAYKYHRTIIERIKSGKPWFYWDDGKAITTVTYSEDFAIGTVGLFFNAKAINEDFNITTSFCYTQKEIVELLFTKLGATLNVANIDSKVLANILPEFRGILLGDRALDAKFDNSKIIYAVPHLQFKTTLDEGLDHVIDFWENCKSYKYDYAFDARIDKMLNQIGIKCNYIRYPNSHSKSKLIYFIYRYFPLNLARRLSKWI